MKRVCFVVLLFSLLLFVAAPFNNTVIAAAENNFLAEISYNEIYHKNGSIVVNVQVWINTAKITEQMTDKQKEDYLQTVTEFYDGLNSLMKDNGRQSKIVDDYLEISLVSYDNITDRYIDAGIDGYSRTASRPDYKMGLFFDTWTSEYESVYSGFLPDTIFGAITVSILTLEGLTTSNIAYIYNYCTKYSNKYITSNADSVFAKADVTVHSFIMGIDELDRQIIIKQHTPNQLMWYGLVLFSGAVFTVVIIVLIKKKKI